MEGIKMATAYSVGQFPLEQVSSKHSLGIPQEGAVETTPKGSGLGIFIDPCHVRKSKGLKRGKPLLSPSNFAWTDHASVRLLLFLNMPHMLRSHLSVQVPKARDMHNTSSLQGEAQKPAQSATPAGLKVQ